MKKEDIFKNTQKILFFGLFINLILSTIKFAAGYFGSSSALTADAVHSLSDSATDVIIMIGALFWTKPPDTKHPYGHRRIETLTTVILGIILILASISIGYDAISGFSKEASSPPKPVALYTALLSIFIKEGLYRVTYKYGKKLKSPAILANAWHHRLDALSSLPAFFAIGAAILFPDLKFLDLAGALVVSVFVFQAAIKILWPGIEEILEKGASDEICKKIIDAAINYPGVIGVKKLRTRYQGMKLFADIDLIVNGQIRVYEGHEIAENVKKEIMIKNRDIADVVIHVEPSDL